MELCEVVSYQGAQLCPACTLLLLDEWKRDRRAAAACTAMARVLAWAAAEALAQTWARDDDAHGNSQRLYELRALALRGVLADGRGLRLEWTS